MRKGTVAAASLALALSLCAGSASAYPTFPNWVQLFSYGGPGDYSPLTTNGWMNPYEVGPLQVWTPNIGNLFQFYTNGPIRDGYGECVTDHDYGGTGSSVDEEWCSNGANQNWYYNPNDLQFHGYGGDCISSVGCYDDSNGYFGDCPGKTSMQACSSGVQQTFTVVAPQQVEPPAYTMAPYAPGVVWDGFNGPNYPLVLDVQADGRANGTLVDIATYNATPAQYWWYEPSTQKIHVTDSGNPPMCLDVPWQSNGVYNDGLHVQIWQCYDRDPQQQWIPMYPNQLINAASGKCLDASGTQGSGTLVEIWDCTGGLNQQWGGTAAGLPRAPFN